MDVTHDGAVTWRALLDETRARLEAAGSTSAAVDAWRMVEEASGWQGAAHHAHLDDRAKEKAVAHLGHMIERRLAGEPLQYVVGRWGFRTLDLAVDRRALIPRPETEGVVDHVLAELDRVQRGAALATGHREHVVVDLGTGTGAIALSVAAERAGVSVWATDRSTDALALARANLAGLGTRVAPRVRMEAGDWYAALPGELVGRVAVVASNPPYVAAGDPLPPEVRDWEPCDALVSGPSGLESIEVVVAGAPSWLRPGGALVVEIGESQGRSVVELARAAGLTAVAVHPDLAGRDRVLVARRPR